MTIDRYHIAIELIEAIGEYLNSRGLDSSAFFARQGFSADNDDHDGYVDFNLFAQLFDAAEVFSGERCIGLQVGANFLTRHWGRLGYLIMAVENGLEGVQYLQRFARIVTNALEMKWHWDQATLSCEFNVLEAADNRHVCDYFVSSSLSLARVTNSDPFRYREVYFQHDDAGAADEYARILECDCHFNADSNRIVVDVASLNRESPYRDPRLKKILEDHAQDVLQKLSSGDELIAQVRKLILADLSNGVPALKSICESLGQNERTFQRALAKLGLNYQDLVDELRMNLALEYIRNDYNFLDIAMMLGYSEQSAFHRAFKRWTGMPPSRYRKQQLAQQQSTS